MTTKRELVLAEWDKGERSKAAIAGLSGATRLTVKKYLSESGRLQGQRGRPPVIRQAILVHWRRGERDLATLRDASGAATIRAVVQILYQLDLIERRVPKRPRVLREIVVPTQMRERAIEMDLHPLALAQRVLDIVARDALYTALDLDG